MIENQQQQTKLLRQGLLIAPRDQRPENISGFRRLQLVIFTDTEKLLMQSNAD